MLFHVQFLGLELIVGPILEPEGRPLDKLIPLAAAALPVVVNLVRERFKTDPTDVDPSDVKEVLKALNLIDSLHKELLADAEARTKEVQALEEVISALVARVDALENPGSASNGLDAEPDPVYAAASQSL